MIITRAEAALTITLILFLCLCMATPCWSKPDASPKFSVVRQESPTAGKETLILPYGFDSEAMGATFGVGGMIKGYHQDQLLFAGTVFGSSEDAKGVIGGMWDYRFSWAKRLYFSFLGSVGSYPRQRAYTESPRRPSGAIPAPAGTNDSAADNFVEDEGDDNWLDLKLEYVLPIGSMKNDSMARFHLKKGILQSGATGGEEWNPITSGVSIILLGQKGRYQSYKTDDFTYDGDTFPFRIGFLYDNTDYPVNPTRGSLQYFGYSRDFSDDSDVGDWSFIEFEASKYFDFGSSENARQRVLAFNFWTGTSPSWEESLNENGDPIVENNPPFFEGAHLGGFYRMRGYPNNRFNDQSVIYTAAEYRHTLEWNPVQGVPWLNWLRLDWFQLAAFVEGGRVAGEYAFDELFTDWKYDGGIGIRAMTAGAVVRLDIALSEEDTTAWVMFGQPF